MTETQSLWVEGQTWKICWEAVSDILELKSMEEFRWVLLDQRVRPHEQQVACANSHVAQRILGEPAERYAARSGLPA
jgi:hypothetical protein